jgi:pimeloyl-ACP methyl ester carboxylesterase
MVLLHSGGSSSRHWDKIGPQLKGFRRIALDMFGYGASDLFSGPDPLDHDIYGDLMATFAADLGGRIHVVGHSYGGSAAIRYATRYPHQIASLTLIEPVLPRLLRDARETALYEEYASSEEGFRTRVEAGDMEAAWRAFIDRYSGEGSWDALPDKVRKARMKETDATVHAFHANLENSMTIKRCGQIRLPVCVISGSETRDPDRRTAEILGKEILGASHIVIEGAGHMSPLTHPDEVAAAILSHAFSQMAA